MTTTAQRPTTLVIALSLLLSLATGCTTTQALEPQPFRSAASQGAFTSAQLDALLAPIALYPDTVLSHVLIASTYPLEVVEADRWARNNRRYQGEDAVNAVDNQDWDPSVKALVAFPDLLQRMSDDLDWTQQLGDAFLADEARVMDSIQNLRNRAYEAGSLDKVEHVRVIREERTIVIEPSVERVVYVPAYDTRVVYGSWWWPDYPPVYWHHPSSYVLVSGFYWGPRVYLGPRFYFSGVHWHHRRVVVVDHHHHHRFYDSRSLVGHREARHWHHNPSHRRGVAYYDNNTRERFNSPRESYRDSQQYRSQRRDTQAPGRDEQFMQRLQRTQAGPMGGNDARDRIYGRDNPPTSGERAQNLRERLEQNRSPVYRDNPRPADERAKLRQTEMRAPSAAPTPRMAPQRDAPRELEQRRTLEPQRLERLQNQRPSIDRSERPAINRVERGERPMQSRMAPSDNRASMRAERER